MDSHSLVRKINRTSSLYLATILFLVTFIVYLNTLGNGLFFDDEQFIYDNKYVQSFSIGTFFTQSLTSEIGELTNYYRPLLFTTFSIEYLFFKDSAFIYHLNSLLIHSFGGIFLFLYLKRLFKNTFVAFTTSLLFLIHPVQTEAVSYVSGRGDPLAFLLMMITLFLSLSNNKKAIHWSYIFFIGALLSKELALMTPFLIFISHLFKTNVISKKTIISALKKSSIYFIIAIFYFVLRITVFNFANTLNFYKTENDYSSSLFVRLNTFLNILPIYGSLLILPVHLFMERDVTIQIYKTITMYTFIVFSFFIGMTGIFWYFRKNYSIFLFSFLWFIIAFGPTSGIIPINGIFYEHFLYFPSVGFFLFLSYLLYLIIEKGNKYFSFFIIICFFIYITFLSIRTIGRNFEWNNPITFYNQTLQYAKTARIYNNLAMAYAESNNHSKAIETYKKAINFSDVYPESHYNLGNTYSAINDYKNAEREYKEALRLNPYFYLSFIKLFELYKNTNNKEGITNVLLDVKTLSETNSSFDSLYKELKQYK